MVISAKTDFKRVPAVDKCFAVLDLLAREKSPQSISGLAAALALNKSTVFNLVHTLADLGVLEKREGRFSFGPRLFLLGRAAEEGTDFVRVIHPFLEEINVRTGLTVFLGVRSGRRAVILDKAESPVDLKVSTDIGTSLPVTAGAGGLALLCQLQGPELEELLPEAGGQRAAFEKKLDRVREEDLAIDLEEYIKGIRAVAVPVKIGRPNLQLAVWAVGLSDQLPEGKIQLCAGVMRQAAQGIENRFVG